MPTTPPTITAAPTAAPQRGVKATFSPRLDAFVTWLYLAVSQFAAVALNTYNNALDALNSAIAAANSAAAAAATSGVTAWVSGTTYAVGDCRFSLINGFTYRRFIAGAGGTDPALDSTNWVPVTTSQVPLFKVSDRKATGTGGGAAVGATISQVRTLNTVDFNNMAGASLASNVITLPSGTYDFNLHAPAYGVIMAQAFLYNVTDATYTAVGPQTYSGSESSDSVVQGRFTIASSKTFVIRHYTHQSGTLGYPSIVGPMDVYTEAQFWKVA